MKRVVIYFLMLSSYTLHAQDLFNLGLNYYEKGQYVLADSIFKICIEKSKPDVNLWFSYASTRLYLKDTSTCCTIMWNLSYQYNDREAAQLFLKLCGSVDTIFYDKNFIKCNKENARYTENIRIQKGQNYKMCFLHDKRKKGSSVIMSADYMNLQETDVIAQYQVLNNGSKLYLFTMTPPTYLEGDDSPSNYIDKSPYVKEAKEKLNVSKLTVSVEYILDRNNVVSNIEIINTNKPVADKELLKKYIDLIILAMPRKSPGKFRNEYVDFLIEDSISIW
jgi:hypothetical protein